MFDITHLTGVFGAEISNIDLSQGWDVDVVSKVRETLRDHKVLVIRDQRLSARQLADFASEFGTPEKREHPVLADFPGVPEVKVLLSDGDTHIDKTGRQTVLRDHDGWHTDGSVRADTNAWFSFLNAEQVPPYGRDTLFADMEEVYDRLSTPLQQFLSGLTAVHAWPGVKIDVEGFTPVEHPVVVEHPETGRRSLYVNQLYTSKIVGLHAEESSALLSLLYEQAHRPVVQLRVVWKPGTLTIYDNRRTQHYAIMDSPGHRVMHRVMVTPSL